MDGAVEPAWYALRVRPQREKLAARWLTKCGIGHDLPLKKHLRKKPNGKTFAVKLPALPGYLFMAVPFGRSVLAYIDKARECPFIRNAVGTFAGEPWRLDQDWRHQLEGIDGSPPPPPRPIDYDTGDTVRIVSGAMTGLFARVVSCSEREAIILQEFFGTMRPVVIPAQIARLHEKAA